MRGFKSILLVAVGFLCTIMSGCAAKAPPNSPPALNIAHFVLSQGAINVPYRQLLIASGGRQPYTWSITSGALPAGLSVTSDGIISGNPSSDPSQYSSAGCLPSNTPSQFPIVCNFAIKVTDSQSPVPAVDTSGQSITINQDLSFTPTPLASGIVGLNYSQTVQASNGVPPYSYMVATCDACGALPDGLTLMTIPSMDGGPNMATISGVPTTAGTYTFTLQVTDRGAETATAVFTLVVSGRLQGSYVLSFNGFSHGQPFYLNGTLVADGNGNITSGVLDQTGPGATISAQVPLQPSIYVLPVGTNFGTIYVTSTLGAYPFIVVLSNVSDSKIILSDANNPDVYGSGLLKKQTATSLSLSPGSTQNYAYTLFGNDAGGNRYAGAGIFALSSSLSVTGGAQDTNDNGTPSGEQFITGGSFGLSDSTTGRGTASLTVAGNTSNYTYYVVTPMEMVAVSSDPNPSPMTLLDIQIQQSAGATGGIVLCKQQTSCQSVVQVNGVSGSGSSAMSEAQIGVASFGAADQNGNGSFTRSDNVPAYYTDQDIGGTVGSVSVASGTYSIDPTCGMIAAPCGRITLNLPGVANPPVWYLVTTGQGFIVSTDAYAESGALSPQSGTPFGRQSLLGAFLGGTVTPTTAGVINEVDVAGTPPPGGTWHETYYTSGPPPTGQQTGLVIDAPYNIDLLNPVGICDPMSGANCLGSALGRFAICAPNTPDYCSGDTAFTFDPTKPPLSIVYVVGGGASGATGGKTGLGAMGVGVPQSDGTATLDPNPRQSTLGR
jgi:hypothetical protein